MRVYQFRHIRAGGQCSRTISGLKRGLLIVCGVFGLAVASPAQAKPVEVVVTLKQPPLAEIFARRRTLAFSSFVRPHRLVATAPASVDYLQSLEATQVALQRRIQATIPGAEIRWRYGVVLNGLAVVMPSGRLGQLARIPGVQRVWPNRTYRALLDRTPQLIGAPQVWGPTLATAGEGMKIGIIDDGIDQTHPFFAPRTLAYPPGFPKGQTAYTTPKVIVARAFTPAGTGKGNATLPFDPLSSDHGQHVAGIAGGDDDTVTRTGLHISGIAPRAYLGNYRAATISSVFGLNANAPELAAAVEAAVRDGMNVINLSFGEVEIEPSRDLVVRALNNAANAGVVSAVSAGNDFAEFGFGSVSSPASATKTIAVAASSGGHGSVEVDAPADYSSAGPTPYSFEMKPDVTAPGSDVLSSFPNGAFGELSGTSMAAPHVAGAAAVLLQRHPNWSPSNVKSALVLTGDPVHVDSREVSPLREGGGRINLPRADQPLLFAAPSSLSFGLVKPGATVVRRISLSDAGGGAGEWNIGVPSPGSALIGAPAQLSVPGTLTITVRVRRAAQQGDVSGFIVLSRGGDRRRIPFWFFVERPQLPRERRTLLTGPGDYSADTAHGVTRVTTYRYPEVVSAGFPTRLPGREVVFRVLLTRRPANFGVVVTGGGPRVGVEPRIVRDDDENRLAGYTALPLDLNPYRSTFLRHRLVAGVLLPAPGVYDVVFDTPKRGRPGPFRFHYWVGDTTPPSARILGVRGRALEVALSDAGAGVDPQSVDANVDGLRRPVTYSAGRARVDLSGLLSGHHTLIFRVSDYQETKNTEDISLVLPNTRTLRTSFTIP